MTSLRFLLTLLILGMGSFWALYGQESATTKVDFTFMGSNGASVPGSFVLSLSPQNNQSPFFSFYLREVGSSFSISFSQMQIPVDKEASAKLKFDKAEVEGVANWDGFSGLKRNTLESEGRPVIMNFKAGAEGTAKITLKVLVERAGDYAETPLNVKTIRGLANNGAEGEIVLSFTINLSEPSWQKIAAMPDQPYAAKTIEAGRYMLYFEKNSEHVTDALLLLNNVSKTEYKKARTDPSALQNYIQTFNTLKGRGIEVSKGKARLDSLNWEIALQENSLAAYCQYLRSNGKLFVSLAEAALEKADDDLWDETLTSIKRTSDCQAQKRAISRYIEAFKSCERSPTHKNEADQQYRQIANTCDEGPDPPKPATKTSPIQQDFVLLQESLSCIGIQNFMQHYASDPAYEAQYAQQIAALQKDYCPIVMVRTERIPDVPLGFRILLDNFSLPLLLDSVVSQNIGLTRDVISSTGPVDSLGVGIVLPDARDYRLRFRDGRDSLIWVTVKGSLSPLSVAALLYDEEQALLTFSLSGGQAPYYFKLKKADGTAIRGIYKLTPQRVEYDPQQQDSVYFFALRPNEQIPVPLEGTFQMSVTDLGLEEMVIMEELPVSNRQNLGLWKILILPLLLMVGFLFYRNRNTRT